MAPKLTNMIILPIIMTTKKYFYKNIPLTFKNKVMPQFITRECSERSNGMGLGPIGLVPSQVRILSPAAEKSSGTKKSMGFLVHGNLVSIAPLFKEGQQLC